MVRVQLRPRLFSFDGMNDLISRLGDVFELPASYSTLKGPQTMFLDDNTPVIYNGKVSVRRLNRTAT